MCHLRVRLEWDEFNLRNNADCTSIKILLLNSFDNCFLFLYIADENILEEKDRSTARLCALFGNDFPGCKDFLARLATSGNTLI